MYKVLKESAVQFFVFSLSTLSSYSLCISILFFYNERERVCRRRSMAGALLSAPSLDTRRELVKRFSESEGGSTKKTLLLLLFVKMEEYIYREKKGNNEIKSGKRYETWLSCN